MHVEVAGSFRGSHRKNQVLVHGAMIVVAAEIPSVIGIAPPEIAVIPPDIIVISQATKAGSQLL
jgi:hypothetical protein